MPTAAERLLEQLNGLSSQRNVIADRLALQQATPLDEALAARSISSVSQNSIDALNAQALNAGAPTSAGFVAQLYQGLEIDPANAAAQALALQQADEAKRIESLKTQLDSVDSQFDHTRQNFQLKLQADKAVLDERVTNSRLQNEANTRRNQDLEQQLTQREIDEFEANAGFRAEKNDLTLDKLQSALDTDQATIKAANATAQAASAKVSREATAATVKARQVEAARGTNSAVSNYVNSEAVEKMINDGVSIESIKRPLLEQLRGKNIAGLPVDIAQVDVALTSALENNLAVNKELGGSNSSKSLAEDFGLDVDDSEAPAPKTRSTGIGQVTASSPFDG